MQGFRAVVSFVYELWPVLRGAATRKAAVVQSAAGRRRGHGSAARAEVVPIHAKGSRHPRLVPLRPLPPTTPFSGRAPLAADRAEAKVARRRKAHEDALEHVVVEVPQAGEGWRRLALPTVGRRRRLHGDELHLHLAALAMRSLQRVGTRHTSQFPNSRLCKRNWNEVQVTEDLLVRCLVAARSGIPITVRLGWTKDGLWR